MHKDVMSRVDRFLEASGIKGMKWGVRRDRGADGTVGGHAAGTTSKTDAEKAREIGKKAKRTGVSSLSNEEMQTLVNRMSLEAKYSQISKQQSLISRGRAFADRQLKTGKTLNDVISFANSPAGNLIAASLRGSRGAHISGRRVAVKAR